MRLRYVLIADGSSDTVLHPVIRWTLRAVQPEVAIGESPTLLRQHRPPAEVVQEALRIWEPDLIIVHRDAEAIDPSTRREEVPAASAVVPLVPVRMTEAWLLFHEGAIRAAAGCPRGTEPLDLPRLRQVEAKADPKAILEQALRRAAGSPTGRALRRFQNDLGAMKHRVAGNIHDFAPLRALPAFAQWEADLAGAVHRLGRLTPPTRMPD